MNTAWNLKQLYKSDNDPQIKKDLEKGRKDVKAFIKKWKTNKGYLVEPEKLFEALEEYNNIGVGGLHGKPLYYFGLKACLDQTDKKVKAREKLIADDATQLGNQLTFFTLNIGKIKKVKQKEILKYKKLEKYKHNLERSFETAKYDLSEKEENIISLLLPNGSSNWVEMLSEFISKETVKIKNKELTFEDLMNKLKSKDKKERDFAGTNIDNILNKWVGVAEHEVNNTLDVYKKERKLRKIKEIDKPKHISDDIQSDVVHAMVKAVTQNFSISHRFYKLFAKLNNQKKLGYHERVIQYGEVNLKAKFEEAFELVHKTYTNIDKDLGDKVKSLLDNGCIDVYPKKGKMGGAFCAHSHLTLPTYILLNHNDSVDNVLTLAHELGHAVNNLLIFEKQPSNNTETPTSTAEVASTFFEDFVLEELEKRSSDEDKFNLLVKKLQDDVGTIFRQVACYNFELQFHKELEEKGYIPQERIGELFKNNMMAYLGDSVEMTKDHNNWWVYWSHIRSPFYVYSYASGLLISKSLQSKVKNNPQFINKVKEFLSTGVAKSPQDIFSDLGINISDLNFWEEGLNEIERNMSTLESLAKKLGKV